MDTQVRILGAGTPDRGELAFAVQLKAAPRQTLHRVNPS